MVTRVGPSAGGGDLTIASHANLSGHADFVLLIGGRRSQHLAARVVRCAGVLTAERWAES